MRMFGTTSGWPLASCIMDSAYTTLCVRARRKTKTIYLMTDLSDLMIRHRILLSARLDAATAFHLTPQSACAHYDRIGDETEWDIHAVVKDLKF